MAYFYLFNKYSFNIINCRYTHLRQLRTFVIYNITRRSATASQAEGVGFGWWRVKEVSAAVLHMHHYLIMLTAVQVDFLNTNEVRGERVLLEISPATICIVFLAKRAS